MVEKKEVKEEKMEEKVEIKEARKEKKMKEETTENMENSEEEKMESGSEEAPEKKEKKKDEKTGVAYITSSGNNTIVHITDLAGNTISRVSGGMITKHSRLKANPTIAMFIAKKAAERATDLGFTKLYVKMRGKSEFGHGPGAHAAVKSLGKAGFNIISILDTTKVARGGPKKKGGRRGRRV